MKLDKKGQCCDQPPVRLKILWIDTPALHYLCTGCNREYNLNGTQRENFAWKRNAVGSYSRRNA